jgi:hypothetical protein
MIFNEIKSKIKIKSDKCFIIGNGPSLNNIDISIFKNEVTIACNSFMEGYAERGIFFEPTILCGGDASLIKDTIRDKFEFDNNCGYEKVKNKLIYIYHPSALIRNCYNISSWKPLCPHVDSVNCTCHYTRPIDMKNFQKIMDDNKSMYLIEDFESFKLTKNIFNMIGNIHDAETDKKVQILKNYEYCNKYHNVIPMISMLIAEQLGYKRIYLVGCDGCNFDKHFYDKFTGVTSIDDKRIEIKNKYYGEIYYAINDRYIEFKNKGITLINCSKESVYDMIFNVDLSLFIKSSKSSNDILKKYDNYCKHKLKEKDNYNKHKLKESFVPICILPELCDEYCSCKIKTKRLFEKLYSNLIKNTTISNNINSSDISINNIKSKLNYKNKDRCFIIGSHYGDFDLSILKDEITIGNNSLLDTLSNLKQITNFVPTIICGECPQIINKKINQSFDIFNCDNELLNDIIHIYNPYYLISQIYNIHTWEIKLHNQNIISQFDKITNNKNIYLIKNFNNDNFKMEFTKDIKKLIGHNASNKCEFHNACKNIIYSNEINNIIQGLSIILAKQLGFKNIYLIGCNKTHQNNTDSFNILYDKYIEYKKEKINITSCDNNIYDFIKVVNLQKIIDHTKKNNLNNENAINSFDDFCKIETVIENIQLINKKELDIEFKESILNYDLNLYKSIQNILN